MSGEILEEIRRAVREYDDARGKELTEKALKMGVDPIDIIQEGFAKELLDIGQKFASGDLFILDLVSAAKVAETAMPILQPVLEKSGKKRTQLATMVLGTVEGDIHDIGKNIVGSVLRANGLEVIDIGKDVPTQMFVEKVKETNANMVGASALLTTTILRQKDIVEALKKVGLRDKVKVIIGGAACSQEWADEIGADAYGADAIDAVEKVKKLLGK